MAVADRIVVMNQGRVEDIGPPQDIYLRPKTLFSAAFMGEINLISGLPNGQGIDTPLGYLSVAPVSATGQTLCLRPEAIGLAGDLPLGPARLTDVAFFGTHHRCHFSPLAAPQLSLIVHLPQTGHPEIGAIVSLFATAYTLLETL